MAEPTDKLYVAHEGDLETLLGHWRAARDGDARFVVLSGALGSGKRAMVGELCRTALAENDDLLLWRVAVQEEEDGLQTLLRIYAALFAGLHRTPALRGKVEMALNSQLPGEPKRVQGWYQSFIDALKKGAPKPGDTQFQVSLPRDNPLIGLVEIVAGIARRFPIVLDIQAVHHSQSLGIAALIEALVSECKGTRLMAVLSLDPIDDVGRGWMSLPLQDFITRRAADLQLVAMSPWQGAQTDRYLASKGWSGDGARIAEICGGRPGFIAELADLLHSTDRLGSDLSAFTMADVVDITPDESELDPPSGEPKEGQRKHAVADDAGRVAYVSALLGLSFPSGLVADMIGLDRDSVDDLLDASPSVYKELQFSQPLGTWVYQFHKALLREGVLAQHQSEEDREIARRVAAFIERFLVPRGYAYLIKALRLFSEYGAPQRSAVLRSMAMANDPPQMWGMVMDLSKYFDDISWPDPLRRTIYMSLLDRMIGSGEVQQTEALQNEAMAWASEKGDRTMQAWLLFGGSRLDYRRQDLYRARDRANDALKLYAGAGDKFKEAEVRAHLGMIELSDGNPNAALDQARLAVEAAPVPPIQAHAAYINGLVEKRARKFKEAAEHFREANEVAGNANQAALALEAGLNFGECLLLSQQQGKAADVLARVVQIAAQLKDPVKQRAASALLAQSHSALRNYEAALQHATATLELTRQLKFTRLEAVDKYNIGFFNLMLGRHTEAVSLLRQARKEADATDPNFQKELLYNLGQALVNIGEKGQAEEALNSSLAPSKATKDWRKFVAASEQLADMLEAKGDKTKAKALLSSALQAAEEAGMKEERKGLRRKLDQLEA